MLPSSITIGKKVIDEQNKPYFVADIAANHDGDIHRAFKLIELAKEAGADCAKFQNFKAPRIVSKKGFDSLGNQMSHQATWDKSVYEVYEEASLPVDWTPLLKEKCDEVDIEYMTSPYDLESVDNIDPYLNAFKIGSGDITWIDIVQHIAKKNKPVLLATGASTLEDVTRAVNNILPYNSSLILMQCNTNYTASFDNFKYINLNVLKLYKHLFPQCILGLSDHTFGHATVLGAIALGARVIEKHFTDHNDRVGPDHKFAMNPSTWKDMMQRSEELFYALGDGVKKIEENETETSVVQRRCLYYQKDFEADHVIKSEDIFPLRPSNEGGLPPFEKINLIGEKIIRRVDKDDYVKWSDFDVEW